MKKANMLLIQSILIFIFNSIFVSYVAAQSCVQPPDGLIAWWPGDGDTVDIVGGRNGTLISGVTFASGKVGQAFSFDGSNFVSIPDDPIWTLGDNPFTVDLWVNFNTVGSLGRHTLVGHDESSGEKNKWIFWFDGRGHSPSPTFTPALRFHINSPSIPPTDTVVAPWTPQTGTWYHVAVTRSGSTYKLYINGVNVATATDLNSIPDPSVPLTIGGAEGLNINGLIDEVEIFNRALSDSEIMDIFNADTAGKCKTFEIEVMIDIKPGSDPNCFNLNGYGVIPVAILGAEDFDVYDINTDSDAEYPLTLQGLTVRVRGQKGPLCSIEHSNEDNYLDMVCHFEDDPSQWVEGTQNNATLTGQLLDGTRIKGTDSICIVP